MSKSSDLAAGITTMILLGVGILIGATTPPEKPTIQSDDIAPACTFYSAIDELRNNEDFTGSWWAEATHLTGYEFEPRFRFYVADFPDQDDRWVIEAPDFDLAACMALERVKGIFQKRNRPVEREPDEV